MRVRPVVWAIGWAISFVSEPTIAATQAQKLLGLTPADFAASATVRNDALDTVATVTTVNGFQEKHGLLRIVWDDMFLRGFIDKDTGRKTYQVYASLVSQQGRWPFFNLVNVPLNGHLTSLKVDRIGSDVDCSGSSYGGSCTYFETVVFEVPEDALREIANGYMPGAGPIWMMRFSGQGGITFDDGFSAAEVSGFLQVMDRLATTIPATNSPRLPTSPSIARPPALVNEPKLPPAPPSPPHPQRAKARPTTASPAFGGQNAHVKCVTCDPR